MPKRKLYRVGGARQLPGGVEYQVPGTNLTRFEGNLHDEGGILLNQDAEVEGGETKGTVTMAGGNPTDYIFSSYLNMDGTKGYNDGKETIADASVKIAKQGGDLNQLAKYQEQMAGRSGNRIARNGGPINYQTEGVIDEEPQFNYPGEQFIDSDSSYWNYYPAADETVDPEWLEGGMSRQGAMRYFDDSKLTDYSWILPPEVLSSSGSGTGSNYSFNSPSDQFNEFYSSLDKNDPLQFLQMQAMDNLKYHHNNDALYSFVGANVNDYNSMMNFDPMPGMRYNASLAKDLYDDYQDVLIAQGNEVAAFNNDFSGGPILATENPLTAEEIQVIREERLSNIAAAWPEMNDNEKFVVFNNLSEFAPDAITDYQQAWFNELQSDAWQMSQGDWTNFKNSRVDFIKTMELVDDPTQQDIFGTQPGQIGSTEGIGAGTQIAANIIDILGFDVNQFGEGNIANFNYDQWVALGMPSSYEDLGILPFTTMMDGDKIFLENGEPNHEYIRKKFGEWHPEGSITDEQYMEAGIGKGFTKLWTTLRNAPGAIKYIRNHGWKNYWGGLNKGKKFFKDARSKKWTQHPSSKMFKSNTSKKTVKSKEYPNTWGGSLDKQLSRDGFIWQNKKQILFWGGLALALWETGRDIHESVTGGKSVEESEGYEDTGGMDNFHTAPINIIDINDKNFDAAVLDSIRQAQRESNPEFVPEGDYRKGGPLEYQTEGLKKKMGGPVQYQSKGIITNYELIDGTVYYKDDQGNVTAFNSPEEYETHRQTLGLDPDPEFKDMSAVELKTMDDSQQLLYMDAHDKVSTTDKYSLEDYYKNLSQASVNTGNTGNTGNTNNTGDRSKISTTNVASDVYYEGDVYGDIAKQQGKQTFEFTDGKTIDLYGDTHLFDQIGAGGVDAWGADWMKNANPEILTKAGITSFADFSDPAKVLAYQKAWNAANPNNLIREDSYFGEQTTRTAFAADPNSPPTEEDKIETNWKSPNNWKWLIPAVGAAAQLIGPLKARKLKPHFTQATLQPKTSLERVDMNQQLASNTADFNALKSYVNNNIGGPASMANIQAGLASKRRADQEVWAKQNEVNAGIANAEAKLNAEIVANNAKNVLAANTFNAEQITRNDETKLAAWDAMGNRIGGMAKDWLSYLAERDKARAVAGPEMYDRNLFFAANPHLDPTSDEATKALDEWRQSKYNANKNMLYSNNSLT